MTILEEPVAMQEWRAEVARDGFFAARPESTAKVISEAGPWEPAVQKIVAFQHLEEDWDGFGAETPSRELLESAIGLAYLLREREVPPPSRVAPGVEGSVILEWQFSDGAYGIAEIVRPFFAEVMLLQPGQPPKHWTLPTE